MMKAEKKEVNAIVLDVLMKGHADDPRPQFKREPVVQAMGLRAVQVTRTGPETRYRHQPPRKVYIGDAERDKIERVKRRIGYDDLTPTAKGELPFIIEQIVKERETGFCHVLQQGDLDHPETPYAPPPARYREETDVGDP